LNIVEKMCYKCER